MVPVLWYFNDLCFSYLNERLVTWLAWNWKRNKHCVPAPLITHNVGVNWESTNPLNTTQTKLLRQAGSNMGLRWFCHCFPPKFNNLCSPFLKTHSPKEGAGEHGSWELTACSKELGQRFFLEVWTPSPSISEAIHGEIFQGHSGQANQIEHLPLKRDKWLLC